jgi:hypothetical protein
MLDEPHGAVKDSRRDREIIHLFRALRGDA